MFKPLEGVKIVDLTQVLAGPYSTYLLALLGADVIKIENVEGGDWTRPDPADASFDGMSVSYMTQGGNKQSLSIDLKHPDGLAVVKQLVEKADVFVENFRPGVAERLGLGFDAVKAIKPGIVYASISAYGQDGPIGKRAAYDHVVQGMCGIMTTTGTPDTVPNKVGSPYVDYATGLNAAFAILAAITQARRDGEAHRVDVAMLDTAMTLMASMVADTATRGTDHPATGNEAFSKSPSSGAFATTDGTLMIAANNERQFANMCKALGREDILDDPKWGKPAERRNHKDSLRTEIEKTIATDSADAWEKRFEQEGVPAARVRTIHEVLNEEQLKTRGITSEVHVPSLNRSAALPGLGFKVDHNSVGPDVAPPALGADTRAVLEGIGLDESAIGALARAGVINLGSK